MTVERIGDRAKPFKRERYRPTVFRWAALLLTIVVLKSMKKRVTVAINCMVRFVCAKTDVAKMEHRETTLALVALKDLEQQVVGITYHVHRCRRLVDRCVRRANALHGVCL
jgi:hypothetical protein